MLLAVQILPWLFQGGQPPTLAAYERLQRGGVKQILSVNMEDHMVDKARDIFGERNVLHVPWEDDLGTKSVEDYHKIHAWASGLPLDRVILCHCSDGTRLATIASIWLMVCAEHVSPYEANNEIMHKHANAGGYDIPAYRDSLLYAAQEILRKRF